jgi:hypothetical protein
MTKIDLLSKCDIHVSPPLITGIQGIWIARGTDEPRYFSRFEVEAMLEIIDKEFPQLEGVAPQAGPDQKHRVRIRRRGRRETWHTVAGEEP